MKAVQLRLDGHTVAEACRRTGLSAPTVSAAWKAFREGGWGAVPVRPRGRRRGQAAALGEAQRHALWEALFAPPPAPLPAWNSRALVATLGEPSLSPRAIEHWWDSQGLKVAGAEWHDLETSRSMAGRWFRQQVRPVWEAVSKSGGERWQGGVRVVPATVDRPRCYQLYLHGKRGTLYMRCFTAPPVADDYLAVFDRLLARAQAPVALVFHGAYFAAAPEIERWMAEHPALRLLPYPT